jgi:hypothetical protein
MQELINQDIFDQVAHADAICITTNTSIADDGVNPMGGGVAGAARQRWEYLPGVYGWLLTLVGSVPVVIGTVPKNDPTLFSEAYAGGEDDCAIVAYPTMYTVMDPADLNLVVRSAQLLVELADRHDWQKVYLAAPGIGIGGLSWEFEVKPAIETILDDRFYVMRIEKPAKKTWVSTEFSK